MRRGTSTWVDLVDENTGEWIIVLDSADASAAIAMLDRYDAGDRELEHPGHTHRSVLLPNETDPATIESALHRGISVLAWCDGDPVVRRSPAALAALAADDRLWNAYAAAVVDIDLPTGRIRVSPCTAPDPVDSVPPAGPMHVLAVCQPGEHPGSDREHRLRHHLMARLREQGAVVYPATGGARDGSYRELSVAASGLSDDQARAWGRDFGQVAVFAWRDASWVLLASVTDRILRRTCRIEPSPPRR